MKVLFVDQFGKTTGRDTLALAELINKKQDMEVEVYLSDSTEIPLDRHYTVKISKGFHGAYEGNFVNKAIHYMKALVELKMYIKKNKFDIVHLQWFSLPWIEWIFVRQLHKLCKVIITVHDVIPFDNRPFEMRALNKIYKNADALCLHTKSSEKLFRENYSAETPIEIITQGFCLKSDYKRIDNDIAKKHFGIPEDAVVFLYYGTIRPSKGLNLLISAIHNAHEKDNRVYLLAAGAFHKVNEEEYINSVHENLGKDFSKVNFGFVSQKEEKWYFSAADVLCLPYLEVTQSGVAQLGLMYELPIIASDIGEMREVARRDFNGIIVSPNDSESLEDAILTYSKSKALRDKHSVNSKILGEGEFSLNNKASRIVMVYKKVGLGVS